MEMPQRTQENGMAENNTEDHEPLQFAPGDDDKWRPANATVRHDVDGTTITAWVDK
jgi:hypothetical protein